VVQMVINMYHGGPDACPFLGLVEKYGWPMAAAPDPLRRVLHHWRYRAGISESEFMASKFAVELTGHFP
jgi:hypothetical protein